MSVSYRDVAEAWYKDSYYNGGDYWGQWTGEDLLAKHDNFVKGQVMLARERVDRFIGGIENLLKLINEIKDGRTERL